MPAKGIVVNPRILAGKPIVKGTRIPVYLVLDLIASGYTFERIVEAYPNLTVEDVKAAVEYAASLLKNSETIDYQLAWPFRFLVDENISPETARTLRALGHDVKSVYETELVGQEDQRIIDFAIRDSRMLITLDLDFGETYYFSRRGEFGVIVVRTRPASVEKVTVSLTNFLKSVDMEKTELSRALVIVNEKHSRVIRWTFLVHFSWTFQSEELGEMLENPDAVSEQTALTQNGSFFGTEGWRSLWPNGDLAGFCYGKLAFDQPVASEWHVPECNRTPICVVSTQITSRKPHNYGVR